jgi:hypothetical protein
MRRCAAAESLSDQVLLDCLASFPYVRLEVTGECMTPALRPGDAVHVVRASARPPRFGDVVLVRQAEGLRLHRLVWPIVAMRRAGRRTRADRGGGLDPAVPPSALLGTVVSVEGGRSPRRPALAATSLADVLRRTLRAGLRRP